MTDIITQWYLWIKALHLIAVIAWMAGLLYLPRLFVYHCEAPPGSELARTFEVMERRLLRAIMNPAMVAVWVFGGAMLWVQNWSQGWLHAKLALIMVLTWLHHAMAGWRKDFAAGHNRHSAKFYRIINETPTAIMVGIVILVIVKPF